MWKKCCEYFLVSSPCGPKTETDRWRSKSSGWSWSLRVSDLWPQQEEKRRRPSLALLLTQVQTTTLTRSSWSCCQPGQQHDLWPEHALQHIPVSAEGVKLNILSEGETRWKHFIRAHCSAAEPSVSWKEQQSVWKPRRCKQPLPLSLLFLPWARAGDLRLTSQVWKTAIELSSKGTSPRLTRNVGDQRGSAEMNSFRFPTGRDYAGLLQTSS